MRKEESRTTLRKLREKRNGALQDLLYAYEELDQLMQREVVLRKQKLAAYFKMVECDTDIFLLVNKMLRL